MNTVQSNTNIRIQWIAVALALITALAYLLIAINILGDEHETLSRRFAVSGGDKFVDVPFRSGVTGLPLLEGVLAVVECRVVDVHEAGDHTIFIGEVEGLETAEGDPLLFFRGKYRRLGAD